MFLIDTNVISEARKGPRADAGVQAFWAAAALDDTPVFLAAITIGELRRGVELIRHRGDRPQALLLEQWLQEGPEPAPVAASAPDVGSGADAQAS
jgi:predicted nucleic acid-binding protein